MQPEQPESFKDRLNTSVNVLYTVCSALALPCVLFLHRDVGSRYVGPRALLTFVAILLAPSFFPYENPLPVLVFLLMFFVRGAGTQLRAIRARMRGEPIHRYYEGFPRLMRFFRFKDETKFKRFEPCLVLVFAVPCMPLSQALGGYLLIAAFAWIVMNSMNESADHERLDAMLDQQIEQRNLVARFRARMGK